MAQKLQKQNSNMSTDSTATNSKQVGELSDRSMQVLEREFKTKSNHKETINCLAKISASEFISSSDD